MLDIKCLFGSVCWTLSAYLEVCVGHKVPIWKFALDLKCLFGSACWTLSAYLEVRVGHKVPISFLSTAFAVCNILRSDKYPSTLTRVYLDVIFFVMFYSKRKYVDQFYVNPPPHPLEMS